MKIVCRYEVHTFNPTFYIIFMGIKKSVIYVREVNSAAHNYFTYLTITRIFNSKLKFTLKCLRTI